MVQRTPSPAAMPAARTAPLSRPSPGFGLQRSVTSALEGLRHGLDDAANWFGERSTAAKIRLVAVLLLLAWLCGIAAPVALISSLAQNNVNYDSAASLAFLQAPPTATVVALAKAPALPTATFTAIPPTATLVAVEPPTDTPEPPTDTPEPPAATATPVPPMPTETPIPPTPTVTYTPIPQVVAVQAVAASKVAAAAPANQPALAAANPAPAIGWDGRLNSIGVRIDGVPVAAGQAYFRVVDVRWENEQEAQGKHHIYVDVLDEKGARLVGQGVDVLWAGGQETLHIEDKPAPEYGGNFPMYAVLGTYQVRVQGLPSETLAGLGMGTPELPAWKIHTSFYVKFQRATR